MGKSSGVKMMRAVLQFQNQFTVVKFLFLPSRKTRICAESSNSSPLPRRCSNFTFISLNRSIWKLWALDNRSLKCIRVFRETSTNLPTTLVKTMGIGPEGVFCWSVAILLKLVAPVRLRVLMQKSGEQQFAETSDVLVYRNVFQQGLALRISNFILPA